MPKLSPIAAIQIDQREPEWIRSLTFGGALTVVTLLPVGDVQVATTDGNLLIIERKTADDLLNTIAQGRFLPQMAGISKASRYCYLIVTGTLAPGRDNKVLTDRGVTGWSWSALQGALLSAQELGVQVVHFGRDEDFEKAILWLASKRHDATMLVPPVKGSTFLNAGEAIIASLPGIGLERARSLLEYCGSAAQALAYLTDLTTNNGHVDGIGRQTKLNARAALDVPEWAELALIAAENSAAPTPIFGAELLSALTEKE